MLVVADLDGDRYDDVAVGQSESSEIAVLLNQRDGALGTATSYATGPGPFALATSDANEDGRLDIVAAHAFGRSVSVLTNVCFE